MTKKITRRNMMQTVALGTVATMAYQAGEISAQEAVKETLKLKGNLKQSVSYWCFGGYKFEEFVDICKSLGLVGVDLVDSKYWNFMLEKEMIVTMGNVPGASIPKGFNHVENHDYLYECYEKIIPVAAAAKVPNIICFSGNRNGISEEEGLENCVIGLKRVVPLAEKHGVTMAMELLNSKDHTDYQCDHTEWGAAIAHKIGSERFKLLYDIYHMQRMEGDLINTVRKYHDVIGHYHAAGNPGRNEIDNENQEINYPPLIKAILDTKFNGYLAHEFIPRKSDKLASLKEAILLCDL